MSHVVKLDKPADFIGKSALLKLQGQPLRKKLVTVVLGSAQHCAWGGEALSIGGQAVGELSSVGRSPKANACVALAYLRGEAAQWLKLHPPLAEGSAPGSTKPPA